MCRRLTDVGIACVFHLAADFFIAVDYRHTATAEGITEARLTLVIATGSRMRTHNQAGEFTPNILGGLIGGRCRYRLADDDVVQLQQIFQLLDREQGLAFVCTQRADELLVAFQCRQTAHAAYAP